MVSTIDLVNGLEWWLIWNGWVNEAFKHSWRVFWFIRSVTRLSALEGVVNDRQMVLVTPRKSWPLSRRESATSNRISPGVQSSWRMRLFQFSIVGSFPISNFQFPILIGFYHWIASESVPVITIHFWLVQARLPGWFHDQVSVSDLLVVPIKVNWFKSLFCVNELRMIETVHLTRLLLSLSCVQNFDKLS